MSLDINNEFKALKDFYTCSKCKDTFSFNTKTIVCLPNCSHIICTECLNTCEDTCPMCGNKFKVKDVNENDDFLKKVLARIARIESLFPAGNYVLEAETETNTDGGDSLKKGYEVEIDGVKVCVIKGAYLKRNARGETSLHKAASLKNSRKLKELLDDPKNDVNCVDWSNCSLVYEAVSGNSKDCLQLLLEHGALLDVPIYFHYQTPLHQSLICGFYDLAECLIVNGADFGVPDAYEKFPLDYCKDDKVTSRLKKLEQNARQPKLVFNCQSSQESIKCTKKEARKLLETAKVANGVEFMPISIEAKDLKSSQVLAAILKAIPVVIREEIPAYLAGTPLNTQHMPPELRQPFLRALHNRLHRLPPLFDGIKFHLQALSVKLKTYQHNSTHYTMEDLLGLIAVGGGTYLKRPPTESSIADSAHTPRRAFHARNNPTLRHCSHFILFDERDPPILQYKMADLRHAPVGWLIKCILNYSIADL